MSILFWLAVLPSILLARSVLSYDKIEKEPASLLIRLFLLGMLSCVPSALIEAAGEFFITMVTDNAALISMFTFLLLVPCAEELSKYWMLQRTRNNPNFNYTFDGIVYGVMVGLGFATLENVLYVFEDGSISTALMRGVLSVPTHCTCGIFMGYYYGVAKGLEVQGLEDRAAFSRKLSVAVPWIIHGLYDYALDVNSWPALILGLAMTVLVFFFAARQVRFASEHDTPIYPDLVPPAPSETVRRSRDDWNSKGTTPPPPTGR